MSTYLVSFRITMSVPSQIPTHNLNLKEITIGFKGLFCLVILKDVTSKVCIIADLIFFKTEHLLYMKCKNSFPPHSLSLCINRNIPGGCHVDFCLTNYKSSFELWQLI
jgi:hypothetical protein